MPDPEAPRPLEAGKSVSPLYDIAAAAQQTTDSNRRRISETELVEPESRRALAPEGHPARKSSAMA